MSNIAKSRGSKRLAGAAALRYRIPAMIDFPGDGHSSMAEQQIDNLWVAGSNPAFRSNCNHPRTGSIPAEVK
jgi:hypothetical protein